MPTRRTYGQTSGMGEWVGSGVCKWARKREREICTEREREIVYSWVWVDLFMGAEMVSGHPGAYI